LTNAKLKPVPRLLAVAAAFGVLAGLLAPGAATRKLADSLEGTYLGLLAANATVFAGYFAVSRRRRAGVRASALVILAGGCLVCLLSLARLPLWAFAVTFGAAVASAAYGLLASVVLLL
jgi:hypothetical protein